MKHSKKKKKKSNSCSSKESLNHKLVIILQERPQSALCRCVLPGKPPAPGVPPCTEAACQQRRAEGFSKEGSWLGQGRMGCGITREGDLWQEALLLLWPGTELHNWRKEGFMLGLIETVHCTIRLLWRFAFCNHFHCQESEKNVRRRWTKGLGTEI